MAGNDSLTMDEVLLLENLMYLTNSDPLSSITSHEGATVGEMLNTIDVNSLSDGTDYGSYITGEDWKNMINAIQQNEDLLNMRIATTNVDHSEGGGGGVSAVFVNEQSGEAVVAFRGTAGNEWKDNFIGGGPTGDPIDGVSTPQQRNALEWYQEAYKELGLEDYSITITGHSKGGNKAKYITLMDDTIDRCISFDGQGFSDEFYEKYALEIGARADKIENHNVDYDYVNLLLNDVGNTTFYDGYDYGDGGFAENHCPNTYFNFDENGGYTLTPVDGRPAEMEALDEFLNSYLRSMPKGDKAEALALVGEIVEQIFAGTSWQEILENAISTHGSEDAVAYLLAYTIQYGRENPEFLDAISGIFSEFGMEDFNKYVDKIEEVLDFKYFDLIFGLLDGGYDGLLGIMDKIPGFVWNELLKLIKEKLGLDLTKEEALRLLGILGDVKENMDDIDIDSNSGKDKKNKYEGAFLACQFSVNMQGIRDCVGVFEQHARRIQEQQECIKAVRSGIGFKDFGLGATLISLELMLEINQKSFNQMANTLTEIYEAYWKSEGINAMYFEGFPGLGRR